MVKSWIFVDLEQILQEAQLRWLRPAEICEILRNHQNFQLTSEPPDRPPGFQFYQFCTLQLYSLIHVHCMTVSIQSLLEHNIWLIMVNIGCLCTRMCFLLLVFWAYHTLFLLKKGIFCEFYMQKFCSMFKLLFLR